VGLHRRFLDGVGGAEAVLEIISGAEVLELGLNHRAKVTGRVVPKLDYSAGIAVKNEDHPTPDLGGWHCHIDNPGKTGLKLQIDAGMLPQRRSNHDRKRK
jgi:hypothetical protein